MLLKERNISFHFIIDNVDIKEHFNFVDNNDLFINTKNLGKFNSIINHVKNNNVKTKYFKSVDPDDYLSIDNFLKLKLPDDPALVIVPFIKNDTINRLWGTQINQFIDQSEWCYISSNNGIVESDDKLVFKTFGNPLVIYPTDIIRKSSSIIDIDWSLNLAEDCILSLLAFESKNVIYLSDSIPFYVHGYRFGYTNNANYERNFMEFLKVSRIIFDLLRKMTIFTPDSFPFRNFENNYRFDDVLVPFKGLTMGETKIFIIKELNKLRSEYSDLFEIWNLNKDKKFLMKKI